MTYTNWPSSSIYDFDFIYLWEDLHMNLITVLLLLFNKIIVSKEDCTSLTKSEINI